MTHSLASKSAPLPDSQLGAPLLGPKSGRLEPEKGSGCATGTWAASWISHGKNQVVVTIWYHLHGDFGGIHTPMMCVYIYICIYIYLYTHIYPIFRHTDIILQVLSQEFEDLSAPYVCSSSSPKSFRTSLSAATAPAWLTMCITTRKALHSCFQKTLILNCAAPQCVRAHPIAVAFELIQIQCDLQREVWYHLKSVSSQVDEFAKIEDANPAEWRLWAPHHPKPARLGHDAGHVRSVGTCEK